MSQVHPLARITPRTRTEIKKSPASLTELAERYNITVATARKWSQPQIEGQVKPLKTFRDYEPGFLHVDIKYLPQMPDETHRRNL